MGMEYELKFRTDGKQQAILRERFPGAERIYTMETTYYDTPALSLSEKKYTLRIRLENGVSVATVKTPLAGNGRGEWETECENIRDAIPVLCKLGAPEDLRTLTENGVIPVCGAAFTRIAKDLVFPEFTAELALDQGHLFSGERTLPLREAELELKSGSPEALERYGSQLAAALGLTPERHSKFRRGLALYKGEKNG